MICWRLHKGIASAVPARGVSLIVVRHGRDWRWTITEDGDTVRRGIARTRQQGILDTEHAFNVWRAESACVA